MSKKHKKGISEIKLLPELSSAVSGGILISSFAYLVAIPIGIIRYAWELKFCVITSGIKKYKSIIKTKREETWWNSAFSNILVKYFQIFDF